MKKMKIVLMLVAMSLALVSCKKEEIKKKAEYSSVESITDSLSYDRLSERDTINIMFFVVGSSLDENSIEFTVNIKNSQTGELTLDENSLDVYINDYSKYNGKIGAGIYGENAVFISIRIPFQKNIATDSDHWFYIQLSIDNKVSFREISIMNENMFNENMTFTNNNIDFLEPSINGNQVGNNYTNSFWIFNGGEFNPLRQSTHKL